MHISFSSVKQLAKTIYQLLKSDRDVVIGVGGETGAGKSTFAIKLLQEFYKLQEKNFDFNLMTWSRKELLTWINGKINSTKDGVTALKEGQLAEYSGVLADELFKMFYRRNWYEEGQIDAIATFNMCRDRHLFIVGNIPNFWDLDTAFTCRVRFYIYIPKRGVAWVFQQENNPFSQDPWNMQENRKLFRKKKNPYGCHNFLFEIRFDDLNAEEKEVYLGIRNSKRYFTDKDERSERAGKLIAQRNYWLKYACYLEKKHKDIRNLEEHSTECGMSVSHISEIRQL